MLDTRYLRPRDIERYEKHWNRALNLKQKLSAVTLCNCIVLPFKIMPNAVYGTGGVIDERGNQVELRNVRPLPDKDFCKLYNINVLELPVIDEECIYLGPLNGHWGHFLRDSTSRLHYAMSHRKVKCIYLLPEHRMNMRMPKVIKRFFELLNLDNIILLSKPHRIKQLVIPDESYVPLSYYSDDYLRVFSEIINKIPEDSSLPKKVYFSRTEFNKKHKKQEIGNELLDRLFELAGFKIVGPELLPLDDQISLIRNADEIACVSGTLVHNLIFANQKPKVYIINKMPYINGSGLDSCKLSGLEPIFCDFYAFKYPVHFGVGPFIYIFNEIMDKFAADMNINLNNDPLFQKSYTVQCINKYEKIYKANWPRPNWSPLISDNKLDARYYDPALLVEWIERYSRYERLEQESSTVNWELNSLFTVAALPAKPTANAYHNIEPSLANYRQAKVNLAYIQERFIIPTLVYETHVSINGWLGPSVPPLCSGLAKEKRQVEAVKIRAEDKSVDVYYQVSNRGEWSEIARNGEECGSTGQSRPITGLKVWLGSPTACALTYRVFSEKWSHWAGEGEALEINDRVFALQIAWQDR